MTLLRVPVEQIRVKPQVRACIREEDVRAIAASIESVGLQQPLSCVPEADDTYRLIDGHHRLEAAKRLGHKDVAVLVVDRELSEADVLTRQLVTNLQRVDLNPIDRAEGLARLMQEPGATLTSVAAAIGLSAASVAKSIALNALPDALKARVQGGKISADAAYLLTRVGDESEQTALAERVANKSITRDALARQIKRNARARGRRPLADDGQAPRAKRDRAAALRSGRLVVKAPSRCTLDELIAGLEELLARAQQARLRSGALVDLVHPVSSTAITNP